MLLCEGSSGAAYHDLFVYQLEKESVKLTEIYHLYTSLPEEDLERSLNADGAAAYIAMDGEEMTGGAIVVIDAETQINHLDFMQ